MAYTFETVSHTHCLRILFNFLNRATTFALSKYWRLENQSTGNKSALDQLRYACGCTCNVGLSDIDGPPGVQLSAKHRGWSSNVQHSWTGHPVHSISMSCMGPALDNLSSHRPPLRHKQLYITQRLNYKHLRIINYACPIYCKPLLKFNLTSMT